MRKTGQRAEQAAHRAASGPGYHRVHQPARSGNHHGAGCSKVGGPEARAGAEDGHSRKRGAFLEN